jgi:ssDNA-binding Zn-finger/Zn-ribbon topoisomerase 1
MRNYAIMHGCQHFKAERSGTIEAIRLRDERWEFRTAFRCPDCGERFVESRIQALRVSIPEGNFDDDA